MKVTIITALAVTGLAGLGSATNGMLKTCTSFSLTGLPSPKGGSMMLSAWCSYKGNKTFSQIDLNKWTAGDCGFTYPPSSGFTSVVSSCSNSHSGDSDFGNNFGCNGPCSHGSGDVFNVFALNSFIGNNNGRLAC
ncbi:hypothetical protein VMCG_01155 [Cytospora schulzeri]|uniref:Cyanovirin-N domain-containing protein n=1 Tax=Cytospora schulzeri TaxID=448051 RepID=A0A423X5B5_9PEZI|nr:hypothetical protein VMCG_01155 [Valsa malicola]